LVIEKACPLFVPLIEEGWVEHAATQLVIREYLDPLRTSGIDTLILGCTHYPLLADRIRACYPEITLVDSASSSADALSALLRERGLANGGGSPEQSQSRIAIWVSDYSDTFHKMAEGILRSRLDGVIFSTVVP
jgi:glutamate racemase